MRSDDKATVRSIMGWWHDLQPDPVKKQAGDRAALAALRRCGSVVDALFEPQVQKLVHRCGARGDTELARLALVAAVCAHVRADQPGIRVARQVGPADLKDDATALCKPLRFRRLMDATTFDECLRAFRRLVALAGGGVNVADLAEALMMWPREGAYDDSVGDRVRRDWVYHYWNAGSVDQGKQNNS
ncbi:type I-E CRISPR-associated protein Cse2/CasB [Novacetimonas hansenii]|uniref:type I-E CRISPR-associated protein Cse2/CasB n=1 Tax=Novacetimonas hansenii TaxID=436 RepID=UPI0039E8EF2E